MKSIESKETKESIESSTSSVQPSIVMSMSFTKVPNTSSDMMFQGTIVSDGGAKITENGVVYSKTNTMPTIYDIKTITGSGNTSIMTILVNLTHETYYARAYAINSAGTSYGSVLSAHV